ncbi:MAG: hypothetical protein KBS86_03685, partial [Proteobacteria bacterium]|nr:hypothetical protein [Candidatus Enterousia scatequi]
MENIFEYFAGTQFPMTMTILVMAVILLFIVLLIYIPTLTKKIFPKFGYSSYSEYLPFKNIYKDDAIEIENN